LLTNEPRQALRDIIAKYGTEICSNGKRCEGLLNDRCGSFRREISILTNALNEHVPLDLLASNNSVPRELLLTRLAKRLEENLALTEDAAVWAVESWALALNIITDAEIAERENKRTKINSERAAKSDLNFDSENRIVEVKKKNFPSNNATQKQPSAPKQPPKNNKPPVFAPPPNYHGQRNNPFGTQNPQTPTHPVPAPRNVPHSNSAQTPTVQAPAKKRSWKLRGCFLGCFLLLALLGILGVGAPYAIKVMRETQQQSEPPRFPQQ
jgi:hypothetical protein